MSPPSRRHWLDRLKERVRKVSEQKAASDKVFDEMKERAKAREKERKEIADGLAAQVERERQANADLNARLDDGNRKMLDGLKDMVERDTRETEALIDKLDDINRMTLDRLNDMVAGRVNVDTRKPAAEKKGFLDRIKNWLGR